MYVLSSICLPDGRAYKIKYNRAGKLSEIIYPDGGYRRYEYGNTPDPSTKDTCNELAGVGRFSGEAPVGGVSLVYVNDGSGEELERAYAYSGFSRDDSTLNPYTIETLVWFADGALQVHQFHGPEKLMDNQYILQFGFSSWTLGKAKTATFYTKTGVMPDLSQFLMREEDGTPILQTPVNFDQLKLDFHIGAASDPLPLLKAEETIYQNHDAGWHWTLPPADAFCGTCSESDLLPMSTFFGNVIPPPGADWNSWPFNQLFFPEWNTVVREKIEKVYEGKVDPVIHRTVYDWADAVGSGGTEINAVLLRESEYDNLGSVTQVLPIRQKRYEWIQYWPVSAPSNMPVRVLNLPKKAEIWDLGMNLLDPNDDTRWSASENTYENSITCRMELHAKKTKTLIDNSTDRWTEVEYSWGEWDNPDTGGSAVRLNYVTTKDSGAEKNTVVYLYDEYTGFIRTLQAWPANAAEALLYMIVEFDPNTGLLLRRMDRNGDQNANGVIDPGVDNFIEFEYDDYNRLQEVVRWHGDVDELLSNYEYSLSSSNCRALNVTRTDHLDDSENVRITTVRNDALGRAAFTWVTTGLKDGEEKESFTRKEFDVMGRVWREYLPQEMAGVDGACNHDTIGYGLPVQHEYDALGREIKTTYPSPVPGGNNVINQTYFDRENDGTRKCLTAKIVEDVNGAARWRTLWSDALGRMVRVDECLPDGTPGAWNTYYTYDLLDRLTQVDKRNAAGGSGQIRNFTYYTSGWLKSAQLPEYNNLSMQYEYDDLGNVTRKTLDSYQESMSYDLLGRLQTRNISYNGQTVKHYFDYEDISSFGGQYPADPPAGYPGGFTWGRVVRDRAQYPDGAAIERFYKYNWQGLPVGKAEVFGTVNSGTHTVQGETFYTTYDLYDRQGQLWTMTYPSGQRVQYDYGAGGALSLIRVNGTSVFGNLTHSAHGAVETMTLFGPKNSGASVNWAAKFNQRLWPEKILVGPGITTTTEMDNSSVLFGLYYPAASYEGNGNIGEVRRYAHETVGTNYSRNEFHYNYDQLNRLTDCFVSRNGEPDHHYQYVMDEFGNITARNQLTSPNPTMPVAMALSVDRATNRLNLPSGTIAYDILGNQREIKVDDQTTLWAVYQDQGHIFELKSGGLQGTVLWRYYYDTDGKRRIKAKADSLQRTIIPAPTQTDPYRTLLVGDCSYSFFQGEDLIAEQDRGALLNYSPDYYATKYLLTDHLGTTRAEMQFVNSVGTYTPKIMEKYDTLPYGELINNSTLLDEHKFFTGKMRDPETSLDYFGFRQLEFGRWTSPDPLLSSASMDDPQTLNRYSYVKNNPLFFNDPTGLFPGTTYMTDGLFESSKPSNITKEASTDVRRDQKILVKMNFVIDNSILDKNGALSKDYQRTLGMLLAKNEQFYGNLGIEFEYSFTSGNGAYVNDKFNFSGKIDGAVNAFVTDSRDYLRGLQGGSALDGPDKVAILIALRGADSNLIIHEFGHFFLGHSAFNRWVGGVNRLTNFLEDGVIETILIPSISIFEGSAKVMYWRERAYIRNWIKSGNQ